jgi:membrane-associated protease RseP (regulator of RpoE activity)
MSEPTPPISYTLEVPNYPQVFVPAARSQRRYWQHILLLLLTIATTLIIGARLQYNFAHNLPTFNLESFRDVFPVMWIWERPARLAMGIPFSATLLGILLAHEFGHFVLAEKNGVYATLPYFIPAPLGIGTFGALIRIKSPIRSRQALFDIGIAGPIAGFLVALPVLCWGLALSKPEPAGFDSSAIGFGYPLIFSLFHYLLAPFTHNHVPLGNMNLHPVGVAAWVGMFATALNLLPGGQFDGGHILYAVAPRAHKWVTRATVLVLIPLGKFWPGWWIWALILGFTGLRHPNVPPWPGISSPRRWLTVVAVLLLALTFVFSPFPGASMFGR